MQLSPLSSSRNLAARMGRWSANHRKIAIFGWLAFVLAAIAIGTAVGQRTIDPHASTAGEPHRGERILKQAGFPQAGRLTEIVAIQSTSLTIADPAFQAVVADVTDAVAPFKSIHNLRSPLATAHRDQVSRDGHTALVEWEMGGTLKAAEKQIDPLTGAIATVAKAHADFYVGEAGTVSTGRRVGIMPSDPPPTVQAVLRRWRCARICDGQMIDLVRLLVQPQHRREHEAVLLAVEVLRAQLLIRR